MRNIRRVLVTLLLLAVITKQKTFAQTTEPTVTMHKGTVINELEQNSQNKKTSVQELEIKLENDETITYTNDPKLTGKEIQYKVGDKVLLQEFEMQGQLSQKTQGTEKTFVITDFQRTPPIGILFLAFIALAIIVGKKQGLFSLISLAISFLIILKIILPKIAEGANPVITTVLASLLITPITFYLSHGVNKKTHISVASTLITLIFTSVLASISINAARLTGYSSDEAMFLQIAKEQINMKGILLAGVIIGFLGVLDDVTVSQASVVDQLNKSKRGYPPKKLYSDAMQVGKDHISSMINTLFLVYAGASLPLLLMFVNNTQTFSDIINIEMVAEEVVRTLVGSIGLILAVPLSTFLSVQFRDTTS